MSDVGEVTFHPLAIERFTRTIEQLLKAELYPHCPRCDGEKMIYARFDDGVEEYVPCPCCHGTGEADREKAEQFIRDWEFREGLDA